MNDLGRMQCSEEVVVLGILRIVEEILSKRKHAHVVINSLLPMPNLRGGETPTATDYQDSFATLPKKGSKRPNTGPNNPKNQGRRTRVTPSSIGSGWSKGANNDQNRRQLFWGRNKPSKDAIMKANQHEQKKYNPVTHQEHRLPLWTSITSINNELKKFCAKHDRVSFFDATEFFAEQEDGDTWVLKTDMISFRGHPTEAGYKIWEDAIVEKAKKVLKGVNDRS